MLSRNVLFVILNFPATYTRTLLMLLSRTKDESEEIDLKFSHRMHAHSCRASSRKKEKTIRISHFTACIFISSPLKSMQKCAHPSIFSQEENLVEEMRFQTTNYVFDIEFFSRSRIVSNANPLNFLHRAILHHIDISSSFTDLPEAAAESVESISITLCIELQQNLNG